MSFEELLVVEEIELLADLIVAAYKSEGRLDQATIDRVLGLA